MSKYIFSEEEINKILLSSPMVLPNNPVSAGLKGNGLRSFFYSFIRELMLLISEKLLIVENDKDASISLHNESEETHNDMRALLNELIFKDTELGNTIKSNVLVHNLSSTAHPDIRSYIDERDQAHANDEYAHSSIRRSIYNASETANAAYNLALGHSSVKVVSSNEAYYAIINSKTKVIGDLFLVDDDSLLDFTYLGEATDTEIAEAKAENRYLIRTAFEERKASLQASTVYVLGTIKVKTSSRDIDTSILAQRGEVITLKEKLDNYILKADRELLALDKKVDSKESSLTYVVASEESLTLENDTEYNLGLRASIILNLPSYIPDGFEAILCFHSGTVATALDCPDSIVFTQDDCLEGKLYPVSNRLYEINIKSVSGVLVARVGAVDYEVIEA